MRRKLFAVAIAAIAALNTATSWADEEEDKAAAQRIATALRDSGKMKGYSIGVKYKAGTAWLNGKVTNKEQATTALSIVSNLEGVDQIVNNLAVAPATAKPAGPARPTATKSLGPEARSQVELAAAQQPIPQKRMTRPAGYKQMPPQELPPGVAQGAPMQGQGRPIPAYVPGNGGQVARATYDQAHMPNYAWPSYAASPNYAALSYPKQYSASAWPFIGPFYPYPQVPLGWRRVSLEWDDGWWFLDFDDRGCQ